jgi:MscS family membrane protein
MKTKFESLLRWYVAVLVFLLWFSIWAGAQPAQNPPGSAPAAGPWRRAVDAHWLSFGLDRIEFLQAYRIFEVPLWQYLASLIYIFLAFYLSKLVDHLIRVELRRWAARTKTLFDDLLLELLHGPVKVVVFVILLHIGLRVFAWPGWFEDFSSKALKIVVACSLTYMSLKLVDLLTGVWKRRALATDDRAFNEQLLPVLRNSLKAFVVVIAILLTSQNLGLNITSLIASLSIGGLALGLAAQDTLGNLFGAVAVFLDKPFRVGDVIKLESIEGSVESIGLRSTRVRNVDGYLITVPNKTMGNAIITNVTLRPNIKTVMNIGLTYDTSSDRLRRAIQLLGEIYRRHPMTVDVWVSFNKFLDSSLNLQVVHWWKATDQKTYLAGMQELNLEVKDRFAQEGIEFAFPTQTLLVRQLSEAGTKGPVGESGN